MSIASVLSSFAYGYVALTIALYVIAFSVPQAGYVARALASIASAIICSTYGVFASILLSLVGSRGLAQWTTGKVFKWLHYVTTGVYFTMDDPGNYLNTVRPAVIVGNHQTELDVLMLGTMFPRWTSVTAKSSLKNMPFLGWYMNLSGTVFIERTNKTSSKMALAGAAETIRKEKQNVYMFPEGTRSYSREPKLLPMKYGAFKLAIEAGVPIIPVIVANYSDALWIPKWKDIASFKFTTAAIPMRVLKPIETKGMTADDLDRLTRSVTELMQKEYIKLTAEYKGEAVQEPKVTTVPVAVKASGVDAIRS